MAPSLPLGASPLRKAGGWTLRLPVRAEHIEIEKRVVVRERVEVRRQAVGDSTRVTAEVRKEVLKVETDGQVRISPPFRQ